MDRATDSHTVAPPRAPIDKTTQSLHSMSTACRFLFQSAERIQN